jgi:hypothetical protein
MLAELLDAGERWRQRGGNLDLGRGMRLIEPSLVDPVTHLPQENVLTQYRELLGIHFFQDLIDQLAPLSEATGAIAVASQMGLEPWYVWARVAPRQRRRNPRDPRDIDVPEQVISRIGDWAIGLQAIDVVGREIFASLAGQSVPREPAVWPILLGLRHRVPHPLGLPEPEREEFVAAVENWERRVETDDFLIERVSLAWVGRFGEPTRSPARARLPGAWRPLHWPEALDPVDVVLRTLLRHAVGVLEGWEGQPPEVLGREERVTAWKCARAALGGLLETTYARRVAPELGVGWSTKEDGSDDLGNADALWRLLLLEGTLRELVGAIRAIVLEPATWLAEYDDMVRQMDYWTWLGLATEAG